MSFTDLQYMWKQILRLVGTQGWKQEEFTCILSNLMIHWLQEERESAIRIKANGIFLYHEITFNDTSFSFKMSLLYLFSHGLNIIFLLHSLLKYVFGDFKLLKTITVLAYSHLDSIDSIKCHSIDHSIQKLIAPKRWYVV